MGKSEDDGLDALSVSVLRELASVPPGTAMSLPRLGKQLGTSVSVLMRRLSLMGHARLGGVDGPGWVRVDQVDARWTATLTEAGSAFCAERLPANAPPAAPQG